MLCDALTNKVDAHHTLVLQYFLLTLPQSCFSLRECLVRTLPYVLPRFTLVQSGTSSSWLTVCARPGGSRCTSPQVFQLFGCSSAPFTARCVFSAAFGTAVCEEARGWSAFTHQTLAGSPDGKRHPQLYLFILWSTHHHTWNTWWHDGRLLFMKDEEWCCY